MEQDRPRVQEDQSGQSPLPSGKHVVDANPHHTSFERVKERSRGPEIFIDKAPSHPDFSKKEFSLGVSLKRAENRYIKKMAEKKATDEAYKEFMEKRKKKSLERFGIIPKQNIGDS